MSVSINTYNADMTPSSQKQKQKQKLCPVCHEMAVEVYPVERIPGKSIFLRGVHENKICEWAKHESIVGVQNTRSELNDDKDIEQCPNCGHIGKIMAEQKDSHSPWIITYSISHGDDKKCEITTQEGRDSVLRALDRYIDPKDRDAVMAEMAIAAGIPLTKQLTRVNKCVKCDSTKTHINKKTGEPIWHKDGTECNKCYMLAYYHKHKKLKLKAKSQTVTQQLLLPKQQPKKVNEKIKEITEKECSTCHSHGTYIRKDGKHDWYTTKSGNTLCTSCYKKYERDDSKDKIKPESKKFVTYEEVKMIIDEEIKELRRQIRLDFIEDTIQYYQKMKTKQREAK